MKFAAGVSVLASLAGAASVDLGRRATPLEVKLETVGNTAVKASITNTGLTALKVFKTGTFLDNTATEKVEVFQSDSKIAFDGIRLQVATYNLDEEAFQIIEAGEVVEATFDIAQMHDLSKGGAFTVASAGALQYTEDINSTSLVGAATFSTNTLELTSVDGEQAAAVHADFLSKRTAVQSDCTGSTRTATTTALSNCRALAAAASTAANSGSASKLEEYFKSSSSSVKSTVSSVFSRVASECGSTTSGSSRYYCSDVYGACSSGVLAYTLPSASYMVNCPLFFSALPALTRTCHAQDQATTVLHEMTHLTQIKGTSDYGTYGYNGVRGLSASQNLNHADTYSLYANAIYVGC